MILSIECEDAYEAQKLAGMMAVQKDGSTFIQSVSSVIGHEVILKLRDGSSHSVTVASKENAHRLVQVIHAVAGGESVISLSTYSGSTAQIGLVPRSDRESSV